MGLPGRLRFLVGRERYYNEFETTLAQHGLLGEPAPVNGHPVLNICLGFSSFEFAFKPPTQHVSFKETRVDRIVQEVFHRSDLCRSVRGEPTIDNEAIVDGFPTSFWFGFENPMLAVLFSMKASRKRKRFNFTKKHKRVRQREMRRRRSVEGRILTSSMILLRNSVSFSSSSTSSAGSSSITSSDSDWNQDNGTGEGRAVLQHYYYQANLSDTDTDSDSDLVFEVNEVSSAESLVMDQPNERNDHMDDGTPGPVLRRFRG